MRVKLKQPVLQGNDAAARTNRALFERHRLPVLNLISSPGAGKTTFLERWLAETDLQVGVIEGDLATTLDAERIAACGAEVVQINTHGACHLDATMIARALDHFALERLDLLVIENVGNLVCPAEFDLGESLRITLLSLTEGDDKPAKYPTSFRWADAVLLTKVDLLPYLRCDLERLSGSIQALNPGVPILYVAAQTGEGMTEWNDWLRRRLSAEGSR
ncbi:MAG TPA: hydrogenase nickel incorporation protein HypB [Symbiobacteriaceae bacterium]|nr:hydrogenase nickel incorporation protein HypB [Symbiobacteriaceae bacterium]